MSLSDRFRELSVRLPRSFKRFLVTGTLTVGVDAVVYSCLLRANIGVNPSKALGLVAATLFAYFVNRHWTFEARTHSAVQFVSFLALYMTAICLNIGVNWLSLSRLGRAPVDFIISWFAATAASSVWNYLGMRHYVFRPATMQ